MRICILSELFYPYLLGGGERRYWEIARRLAKRGHDVTVISLRFPGYPNKETVEGVKIIRVGGKHPLDHRAPRKLFGYLPALFKAMSGKYDIVDANQGAASFVGIWKLLGLTKRPIVATYHDIYSWDDWKRYFRFPGPIFSIALVFGWSMMSYSKIMANSKQTEEKLERLGHSNVDVIVSGVDMEKMRKVKPMKSKNTVIYVGRLEAYKHIDMLIRAMASSKKLKGYKLSVIGEGPEEENLKTLAAQLGIKAEFHGYVSEEEKIARIKGADVLVNPSSIEGLGLILLESMACGTSVVGFDLECYKEFCNPQNSLIVDTVDENALSKTMEGLLSSNARRKGLVKAGLATAAQFSWDTVTKRVESLYKSQVRTYP